MKKLKIHWSVRSFDVDALLWEAGFDSRRPVECLRDEDGNKTYTQLERHEVLLEVCEREPIRLRDNYPFSEDNCDTISMSGGCGLSCSIYNLGKCPVPDDIYESLQHDMTDEQLADHMSFYSGD